MKNLILFFVLIVSFFSCAKMSSKNNSKEFYINGIIEEIRDSTKVYLKVQKSNKILPLDTAYTINNVFKFNGKIDKPEVVGIYIDSLKGEIGLFIQNDSVFIEVNKNNLSDSKIYGSELNNEYLKFVKQSNKILSKTNYLFPLFQKARTENDVDKLKNINNQIEQIHKDNIAFTLSYARNNPESYISAFALKSLLKSEYVTKDTIASIYQNFTHEVKKGDFAIEVLLFLEEK
ncbi:DUF4369 domain-containing protein [Aureibaculum marinum]|uniref:DUF4369 domain-containing protein n=2 Tax=Aureibaculum marinum TaxID=2487930 RepID=A0A3N4NQH7_9FLAO|nr:DUF4369 domain-containing protein [Aureibaculum marinum]